MLFHLTEEQIAIQDALRGTLADVLTSERLHALVDGDEDMDRASWQALMDLGVGGLAIPEEFGGSGLDLIDAALAVEVAGESGASGPLIGHIATTLALAGSGNSWIEKLADGTAIATFAWNGASPDDWDLATDGRTVTGTARFVQSASSADVFLVGLEGGSLGLVSSGDHVSVAPIRSSDRSRRQAAVSFDAAPLQRIDADPWRIFDAALVLAAADALGGAQRCLDMSVAYAKDREQFGQPIGQFQALKHQLAQMALEVEPARASVWYAAHAWDENFPDSRRITALTVAHLKERFTRVARDAVAAHGGIGYTWEYDLSIWFRRSLFSRAFLGLPASHRARAASLSGW